MENENKEEIDIGAYLNNFHERLKALETKNENALTIGDISIQCHAPLAELQQASINLLKNKVVRSYLLGEHFQRKKMFKAAAGLPSYLE